MIAVFTQRQFALKIAITFTVVIHENSVVKVAMPTNFFRNTEIRRAEFVDCCYDLFHELCLININSFPYAEGILQMNKLRR